MKVNGYIDHTLLKPDATEDQIRRLCAEARQYGFASVCVNPCFASLASGELGGSGVKTCVVAGFPLGMSFSEVKALEALRAVENGAEEVDMVINIGALKDGWNNLVAADIASVVRAVSERALVKVIIECCLLSDGEKVMACELAVKAGAAFVKTSTGFSEGGATIEDVRLMREAVKGKALVKAAGGIKSLGCVLAMIDAGADRIGTSSGVAIVSEQ